MWSLIKGTLNVENEEKHNLGPAIKVPNRRIGLIVVGHNIRNLQKLSCCFYSQAIRVDISQRIPRGVGFLGRPLSPKIYSPERYF